MNLPTNTTDRLLAVAQIIDEKPDQWDQGWFDTLHDNPRDAQGRPEVCGTTCCVAGWAIRLTPQEQYLGEWDEWLFCGARALGLTADAASSLFYGTSNDDPVSDILRIIATIPEGQRSLGRIRAECSAKEIQFGCVES